MLLQDVSETPEGVYRIDTLYLMVFNLDRVIHSIFSVKCEHFL